MSELKTTSLSHKDNNTGTPNITMYPDGTTSLSNFTTVSLNGGPLAGFRNQLINGNFQIIQRPDAEITATGFLFDRWYWAGAGRYSRGENTPLGQYKCASFDAGSTGTLQQAIELPGTGKSGVFTNGSQWTFSVYVKQGTFPDLTTLPIDVYFRDNSTSGTNIVRAVNPAPSFVATSETSNGFTRYTSTFNINADPATTSTCLTIRLGVQSAIGACQLEPGPVATPFEHRPIGTELALCQRYYQAFDRIRLNPGSPDPASRNRFFTCPRPVTMRAVPTESQSSSTVITFPQTTAASFGITGTAADTTSGASAVDYTADAEL